jgi:anionic cell wall polymer biosynthesis LytR-Cps2A-Psr (LCP) family protein
VSDNPVFRSVRRPDRRRRTAAGRVLKWTAVLVVVALVATIVVLVQKAATALEPLELQSLVLNEIDPDAPVDEVEGTSTTLLVGVDRRAVQPAAIADSTADPRGPAAALMVALVQTSPRRDGTAVVTFPTDLQVRPPGLLDIGTTRLDLVQGLGGPDALVATIQELTQMPIDDYVEVDLAGVVGVVDAVGGVEVCLDEVVLGPEPGTATTPPADGATATPTPAATPTVSATTPATGDATDGAPVSPDAGTSPTAGASDLEGLSAGCQVLDGPAAAGFLSSRADANQPLPVQRQRIAEQHYLLGQVLERMRLTAVLANPLRVNDVLDSLQAAVASNVDPGLRGMFEVAADIADFDRSELLVRVVPSYRRSEGGDTLLYVDQATTLFQALRAGDELAEVGGITSDEVGPEDVTILVVNGVGTPGLAGSAQSYLANRGFEVACAVNPSDLDPRATFDPDQEAVVLQYLASDSVLAELVVEALGSLPVEDLQVDALPPMPANPECVFPEDGVDVVMTVGSAWE